MMKKKVLLLLIAKGYTVSNLVMGYCVFEYRSGGGNQGALPSSVSVSGLVPTSRSKTSGSLASGTYGANNSNNSNNLNQHPEGPKFPELLSHFRAVQGRHERSRRQAVQALLRLNTYGGSSSGLMGAGPASANANNANAAHYNQQQQYYQQQHQQKNLRKQQQQQEHLQLQQQVQQQQQLYDLAHREQQQLLQQQREQKEREQQQGQNSGDTLIALSSARYQQPDGSFAPAESLEQETGSRTGGAHGNHVASASRRRTRDRQSQLDIMQQQQQSSSQQSSSTTTTTTSQRNSTIKSNAGNNTTNSNYTSRSYAAGSGAGTPPPAGSPGGGQGAVSPSSASPQSDSLGETTKHANAKGGNTASNRGNS